MDEAKRNFIQFLFERGALKVGGDFTIRSGRISPWYLSVEGLDDGKSVSIIGEMFAKKIPSDTTIIFGPSYKGVPLAVATSMELNKLGRDIGFTFDRKEEKNYGEASGSELQIKVLVGSKIKDGDRITMLDNVFTTGQTKYESI
ncbi:orotate phosphoribosyltransferase, partial [Candidatus Pacearchaeota archaeon]|nr:orotate phosphoribosyltransferase [Candidatus Pacearchaeota archaeon]